MIAGPFDDSSVLEIGTYKPSSVVLCLFIGYSGLKYNEMHSFQAALKRGKVIFFSIFHENMFIQAPDSIRY